MESKRPACEEDTQKGDVTLRNPSEHLRFHDSTSEWTEGRLSVPIRMSTLRVAHISGLICGVRGYFVGGANRRMLTDSSRDGDCTASRSHSSSEHPPSPASRHASSALPSYRNISTSTEWSSSACNQRDRVVPRDFSLAFAMRSRISASARSRHSGHAPAFVACLFSVL